MAGLIFNWPKRRCPLGYIGEWFREILQKLDAVRKTKFVNGQGKCHG